MQFIKLTRKNGDPVLMNIAHIIDIVDSQKDEVRYVATTGDNMQGLAVTETLYQIEQAMDNLEDAHGVIVAADWPAEDPTPE